ncbi:MAG: DUF4328 domain-containing protein [Pyrinomonadaceae bacterium]
MKILLIVGAVAAGLTLLAEALSFVFPPLTEDQELGDHLSGAALLLITVLLAFLEVFIYLVTVVFFLMWLYRAHNNLGAFDPWRRFDYSAGWAVGSFFIPFVNLVVPYRAVKEVWQKSEPRDEAFLSPPGTPAWFPIWWLFWLLASFAGNISMRASFNENVSESTATIVSMVAGVLSIVAAVFAYLVVDAIDKRHEETSAQVKLGRFSAPPPPPVNLAMPEVVVPTS